MTTLKLPGPNLEPIEVEASEIEEIYWDDEHRELDLYEAEYFTIFYNYKEEASNESAAFKSFSITVSASELDADTLEYIYEYLDPM